ncbi:MAG TPA: thymidine phosphorylase [Wenzhouxiangellaceae bacterium]|nr:thymidine phosphorylase [Wenzhouxiangellaceae bacterium]
MTPLPQEIIRKKRDGGVLDDASINEFIAGIADGSVADEQLGAFAMAVFLNGMNRDECIALTLAMRDSGRVMQWADQDLPGPVLDKHSTGGVGDAVSLILGPWVAACGGFVPMISGRGLGHTGGTLDKLASIPGYDPFPDPERLSRVVRQIGVAIIGQTDDLAPADRRFYAVRDVTATVECMPLIVASILSKKLAAGLEALVMDVKTGSGSVMGAESRCVELAETICSVAAGAGTPTSALVTDMNQVLGRNAGNALEVAEAIEILRGERRAGRLLEVTRALAAEMLLAGGLFAERDEALSALDESLGSGRAAERFQSMVSALGGPNELLGQYREILPEAPVVVEVAPAEAGFIVEMDVYRLGMTVVELGGGRTRSDQKIDLAVGLENVAGIGERVDEHRPIARIHARSHEDAARAATRLTAAIRLSDTPADPPPPIHRAVNSSRPRPARDTF